MIIINELDLVLDDKLILNNISCKFPVSQVSIIIGRSGAGKSSLLRSIIRLYKYSGNIIFENNDINDYEVNILRKNIAYVGQIPIVFPGNVIDNLNFPGKKWNTVLTSDEIDRLLQIVGLSSNLKTQEASNLSVGEKQRLHLARALSLKPKVLLLDEPSSALDVISKQNFEELIIKLNENNPELTIIIVTHDLDQARRIGEHLILLEQGAVITESSKQDFFNKFISGTKDGTMLENIISELTGVKS